MKINVETLDKIQRGISKALSISAQMALLLVLVIASLGLWFCTKEILRLRSENASLESNIESFKATYFEHDASISAQYAAYRKECEKTIDVMLNACPKGCK